MRPGPGLVVMALAFISGARRGTSQLSPLTNHQQGTKQSSFSYLNHHFNNRLAKYSEDDTSGALARINPWLSACDLAQPNSAPDLQGQCSAGKLPVAWVDEGPGPPQCPDSCASFDSQPTKNDENLNKTNDEHDNNIMDNNSSKTSNNKIMDICDEIRNRKLHQNDHEESGIGVRNNGEKNMDPKVVQEHSSDKSSAESDRISNGSLQNQQQQQCLHYLGDNEASSPAQICKNSPTDIETKLRDFRLRHCCERSSISALSTDAFESVLSGGDSCEKVLNDLVETDALATRITCEFTEILVRYDCRQMYSIIHHCEDCKEAYRRWVCSTLIPYFVETNITTQSTRSKRNDKDEEIILNRSSDVNQHNAIDENLLKVSLKRSRRKYKNPTVRRRVRPCLSVCQTVEQKCPYMLPGDRAPAYPTQYAGEPTFLCLDANIPETGDQLRKSNSGPDDCCYEYCGSPMHGICSKCNNIRNMNKTNSLVDVIVEDKPDELPQCQQIQPQSTSDISTIRTSVLPNTRCPIPYYVGPSAVTNNNHDSTIGIASNLHPEVKDSPLVSSASRINTPLPTQFLIAVSVVFYVLVQHGNLLVSITTKRLQRALKRSIKGTLIVVKMKDHILDLQLPTLKCQLLPWKVSTLKPLSKYTLTKITANAVYLLSKCVKTTSSSRVNIIKNKLKIKLKKKRMHVRVSDNMIRKNERKFKKLFKRLKIMVNLQATEPKIIRRLSNSTHLFRCCQILNTESSGHVTNIKFIRNLPE